MAIGKMAGKGAMAGALLGAKRSMPMNAKKTLPARRATISDDEVRMMKKMKQPMQSKEAMTYDPKLKPNWKEGEYRRTSNGKMRK